MGYNHRNWEGRAFYCSITPFPLIYLIGRLDEKGRLTESLTVLIEICIKKRSESVLIAQV
jgi:hypothetical protein